MVYTKQYECDTHKFETSTPIETHACAFSYLHVRAWSNCVFACMCISRATARSGTLIEQFGVRAPCQFLGRRFGALDNRPRYAHRSITVGPVFAISITHAHTHAHIHACTHGTRVDLEAVVPIGEGKLGTVGQHYATRLQHTWQHSSSCATVGGFVCMHTCTSCGTFVTQASQPACRTFTQPHDLNSSAIARCRRHTLVACLPVCAL